MLVETVGATIEDPHKSLVVAALANATSEDAEPVSGAHLSKAKLDHLRVVNAIQGVCVLELGGRLLGLGLPLGLLVVI